MTKKQTLIQLIKIAGYHNDTKIGTRLFVENRITRADYDAAFHAGLAAKAAGQICTCSQCKGA